MNNLSYNSSIEENVNRVDSTENNKKNNNNKENINKKDLFYKKISKLVKTDVENNKDIEIKQKKTVLDNIIMSDIKDIEKISTLSSEKFNKFIESAIVFIKKNKNNPFLTKTAITQEFNHLLNTWNFSLWQKTTNIEKKKTDRTAYSIIKDKMKNMWITGTWDTYRDKRYNKLVKKWNWFLSSNFTKTAEKEETQLKQENKPFKNYAKNGIIAEAINNWVLDSIYAWETIWANMSANTKRANKTKDYGVTSEEIKRVSNKMLPNENIAKLSPQKLAWFIKIASNHIEKQPQNINFTLEINHINQEFENLIADKPIFNGIYQDVLKTVKLSPDEIKYAKTQENPEKAEQELRKSKAIAYTMEMVSDPKKLAARGYSEDQIEKVQAERKSLQQDTRFSGLIEKASQIYKRINIEFHISLKFNIWNKLKNILPERDTLANFSVEDLANKKDPEYLEYINSDEKVANIPFKNKQNFSKFNEKTDKLFDFKTLDLSLEDTDSIEKLCHEDSYEKKKTTNPVYNKLPKEKQDMLDNYTASLDKNHETVETETNILVKTAALTNCLDFLKKQMNISFTTEEEWNQKNYLDNLALDKKDISKTGEDLIFNIEWKIAWDQTVNIAYNVTEWVVSTYQEMTQGPSWKLSIKNKDLHPLPFKFPSLNEFEDHAKTLDFAKITNDAKDLPNYKKILWQKLKNIDLWYDNLNREVFSSQLTQNRVAATFFDVIWINKEFSTETMVPKMKTMYETFYNTLTLTQDPKKLIKFEHSLKKRKTLPHAYVRSHRAPDKTTEANSTTNNIDKVNYNDIYTISKQLFSTESSYDTKMTNADPSRIKNNSFQPLFELLSFEDRQNNYGEQSISGFSRDILDIDVFSEFTEHAELAIDSKTDSQKETNLFKNMWQWWNQIKKKFSAYKNKQSTKYSLSALDEEIAAWPPTIQKEETSFL